MENLLIFRAVERLLVVLFSGLAIYLGYRLFSQIPERAEGEGKITFGGASIYLAKLGPGTFFALFGCTVIALSLHYSLSHSIERSGNLQPLAIDHSKPGQATEKLAYLGDQSAAVDVQRALAEERDHLKDKLYFLNNLPRLLKKDLTKAEQGGLALTVHQIKLLLMRSVWDKERWGDYGEFKQWVNSGAADPVPAKLDVAAAFYRHGEKQ